MSRSVECEKHGCSYAMPVEEWEKDNLLGECPLCVREERNALKEASDMPGSNETRKLILAVIDIYNDFDRVEADRQPASIRRAWELGLRYWEAKP